MSKVLPAKSEYDIILIDGKEFVEFKTGGSCSVRKTLENIRKV